MWGGIWMIEYNPLIVFGIGCLIVFGVIIFRYVETNDFKRLFK